jgi:hypothetical protein
MTHAFAIVRSALATTIISLLAASLVVSALAPKTSSSQQLVPHESGQLFRLSPIPAGADWARS